MKKTNLIIVSIVLFAAFFCAATSVASANTPTLDDVYTSRTVIDLKWTKWVVESGESPKEFINYTLYRSYAKIATITDKNTTFYRDQGDFSKNKYYYELKTFYYDQYGRVRSRRSTLWVYPKYVHGTITLDTTWTVASSPYILSGSVYVKSGTLTINPGVMVQFGNYSELLKILEKGKLDARGASFISVESSFGEPAILLGGHGPNTIENCEFDCSDSISTYINYFVKLYRHNNTIVGNTMSGAAKTGENVHYAIDSGSGTYHNNVIRGNNISDTESGGIRVDTAHNYTIEGNTISNSGTSGTGINIGIGCWNSTINDNAISNHQYGICISGSNNVIEGNNVSNNGNDGVNIRGSNNVVEGNIISNNKERGIFVREGKNNTIYNNIIKDNKRNAWDHDGGNVWNITKTPGTNIIGGPYLGGNNWSDYTGTDADGDGLGETPYTGWMRDYLPLVPVKVTPFDLVVSDIVAKVLVDGENATIDATVHSDACFDVNDVKARLRVNDKTIQDVIIDTIPKNSSAEVTFDEWNVSWSVKENKKQHTKIEVVIDPDNEIKETDETNNTATREISFAKGKKKDNADGRGFLVTETSLNNSVLSAIYATPIAIWFDDDATATRHYNPIATDINVLNDIEKDFKGTQYSNGIVNLKIADFYKNAVNTFTTFWEPTPYMGIVIVDPKGRSGIAAAPIASYLNWPIAPSPLISFYPDRAKELFMNLNINYTLVIASDKDAVNVIINDLKKLDLDDNQTIFVKGYVVEPFDKLETTDLFKEVLDAYGDKPSSIIVTSSRDVSCAASAPLAAFYKSMILDVRDVVTKPVYYGPIACFFDDLKPINKQVNSIIDNKAGAHDITGFIGKYKPKKPSLYLVGTAEYVPFGIEKEPAGFDAYDSDLDWIASDYRYYHANTNIVPGGRMPLSGKDNLNYVARALQFDELPVRDRDVGDGWEDNIMGVGIYSPDGKRHWEKHKVWWLDPVVYNIRDLSGKEKGMEITRLFECAAQHNGGWGKNWYRFDNQWGQLIKKAPLFWDTKEELANPKGGGPRGDGVNNDNDRVGSENNDDKFPFERIIDKNDNGVYDNGTDVVLNEGLVPGIQATFFDDVDGITIDEEVLDGFDNDGDGTIDEDCSFWRLLEVESVYNEHLDKKKDPDIDRGDWIDLIDTNLIREMSDEGIIIYSGHSWTNYWAISNIGGDKDPDGAGPIPPLTSDNRTVDQIYLAWNEVPDMAPSFVFAASCGSGRIWEANCIASEFLKKGALAYVGSTALAYGGGSEDFGDWLLDGICNRKTIGESFKEANWYLLNAAQCLWAHRYNQTNAYADKTAYEFNLFGLGSTEIDPGSEEVERVTYGTPIYDNETKTWSTNITFDIPEPTEIEDAACNVTDITIDLPGWLSDEGNYPTISVLPFDYELPAGGNYSDISLINATVYRVYHFSQYKEKDYCKAPVEIVPMNMSLNETIGGELELYTGELFPDVLFVNGSEYNSLENRDRVFGSVTAWQVDGTINKTTVYDKIVLKLTYTTPVGVEEVHFVNNSNLTVLATMVSTDGKTHFVKPSLVIETLSGIRYKEVSVENMTVGETPQIVTFEVSEIELPGYVGRITVTEEGKCVAETSFTVIKPIADFRYTHENPIVGQPVVFNASNSTDPDGIITNYSWDLGDNKTGSGQVITHSYSSTGNYTVALTVTDNEGARNTSTKIVTVREPKPTVTNITSFAPPSPVSDTENDTRTFNITIDQTVNVSWQINGTEVQTNTSVVEASYTNVSAKVGTWNVSAIATNANGTNMQTWTWNVEAPSECYIATATYGTPLDENIDVLRDFRDTVLMTNPVGDAFVSTYYATSPPIADALRANDGLRTVTRLTLITPLVYLAKFALNGILVVLIIGLTAVHLLIKDRKINCRRRLTQINTDGEINAAKNSSSNLPKEKIGVNRCKSVSKIEGSYILYTMKILKSLLVGTGSILVFIAAIFSLGFVGYAIPFCAVVGAYMLPFVIPLSVVFTLCTVLKLHMNVRHNIKTHAQNSKM